MSRFKTTAGLYKEVAKRSEGRKTAFTLSDFIVTAGDEVARITLAVPASEKFSEEALADSFAQRFDGEVSLVPESLTELASFGQQRFFTALAQRNSVSMDYKDNIGKLKCIASDTFIDDTDTIWQAIGEKDSRRLVMKSSDDFESILASRRKVMTSPEFASAVNSAPNASYAMYYCGQDQEMKFGILFRSEAGINVIDRAEAEVKTIDPLLVVATATEFDEGGKMEVVFPPREQEVALSADVIKRLVDYYRKVYNNTAFFVKLEQQIRARRG